MCRNIITDFRYAVKIINLLSPGLKDGSRIKLVENEIKIHREINNDRFSKLLEVYKESDSVMLVMELIKGDTLGNRLMICG